MERPEIRETGRTDMGRDEIQIWTAIRGIAAMWVVLYHFAPRLQSDVSNFILDQGHLAVDVFFVLSGVVMYHVYGRSLLSGTFRTRTFLVKRFARIFPVHAVTLAAMVALTLTAHATGLFEAPATLWRDAAVNFLMLQAWHLTDGLRLNYPSWSVSAEFFAYAAFPFVAAAILRLPQRVCLPSGILFFLVCAFIYRSLAAAGTLGAEMPGEITRLTFQFSALRILPEFVMGICVCRGMPGLLAEGAAPGPKGTAISCAGAAMAGLFLGEPYLFVLASALSLGALGVWNPRVPRVLVWLGTISYSLYMVHGVVEKFGFNILERLVGATDDTVPAMFLVPMLLATVLSAALCHRLVERPGREAVIAVLGTSRRSDKPVHANG